ncbi:MAG: NAD(P)-dependent oxidoreductase [Kordiimonadaceae bacterium]|nr:NAD(P)-dependent oxidoreductase [Kordiimonadaceae bacterium]
MAAPKTKILICGATGFIGRNLVNHYAANPAYDVTAIWHKRPPFDTPPNVTWVQADLLNAAEITPLMADKNIIVQAAATTSGAKDIVTEPFLHVTDNAVMNSLLLRAAHEAHVGHFVFFSCSILYPQLGRPVCEDDFTGDIENKYFGAGWTKYYIERMCKFYAGLGRTKHTVIRHSNIYGPHDKFDLERSHVFGASISKTMLAEKFVTLWGTGEEKRDLLHVADLVRFVELALTKQEPQYQLYNCGLGEAISVQALVEKIIAHSGKHLTIKHDLAQPTIPYSLVLNCRRAERELGWKPKIKIDDGIKQTLRWWRENVDPNAL